MEKIKVLIVDDSAIVRTVLEEKLGNIKDIEVVGTAPDPYIARDKIVKLEPDVITLDIEMPRMDGLTFLQKLMTYYPMPVIIVSSVTTKDSYASIKALEIGAFDVVNKPGGSISVNDIVDDIVMKIRQANEVKDSYVRRRIELDGKLVKKPPVRHDPHILSNIATTDKLIAIGASTGGTVALEYIFRNLPPNLPPIVVVEHMPAMFTRQFADRLNEISELEVKEAEDGDLIAPGTVYIAPGGMHLTIKRKGALLFTQLLDTERVHFQKPAVDVLFDSVAEEAGQNAIGFLLTGMGKDGAKGLLNMRNRGAYTVAQDERSSIVWGMPKTAVDLGAADEVTPLDDIPKRIVELSQKK
ncbi:MAG: chemotaxis response regulator protein-glutamate methylesterase [Spirochaetes bacterium GWF1_51_8]|nr:MAG: chemotaxis response regulator protein-glutamate methylesterase [Spirochaetes bacterium GWF1_51_8]